MKGHVSWVNELAVKDGRLETSRELMEEVVSGARTQPGTLAYEWYISPDGGTVHVVETYADCAAVVAHHVSEGFALHNWTGRFMDCVDVTRVVVYGDPNAAARAIRRDGLGATYHSPWGASRASSSWSRMPPRPARSDLMGACWHLAAGEHAFVATGAERATRRLLLHGL